MTRRQFVEEVAHGHFREVFARSVRGLHGPHALVRADSLKPSHDDPTAQILLRYFGRLPRSSREQFRFMVKGLAIRPGGRNRAALFNLVCAISQPAAIGRRYARRVPD